VSRKRAKLKAHGCVMATANRLTNLLATPEGCKA
jgi:hypothetical protein